MQIFLYLIVLYLLYKQNHLLYRKCNFIVNIHDHREYWANIVYN